VEISEDEAALLRALATGATLERAAAQLGLSRSAAGHRLSQLCQRLGVEKPITAVVWAVRRGIV